MSYFGTVAFEYREDDIIQSKLEMIEPVSRVVQFGEKINLISTPCLNFMQYVFSP